MVYLVGCSVKMACVCVFSAAKKTERGVHGVLGLAGGSITLHRTLLLIASHHSWPGHRAHIAAMVTSAISVFSSHAMYDYSHKLQKLPPRPFCTQMLFRGQKVCHHYPFCHLTFIYGRKEWFLHYNWPPFSVIYFNCMENASDHCDRKHQRRLWDWDSLCHFSLALTLPDTSHIITMVPVWWHRTKPRLLLE